MNNSNKFERILLFVAHIILICFIENMKFAFETYHYHYDVIENAIFTVSQVKKLTIFWIVIVSVMIFVFVLVSVNEDKLCFVFFSISVNEYFAAGYLF